MAIHNFFKPKHNSQDEKIPSLRELDQILAWLEELHQVAALVELLRGPEDVLPIQAKVRSVQEEAQSVSLQFKIRPGKEPSAGQRFVMVFTLGRQRFRADLTYRGRGEYLEYRFDLPSAILHAERRDSIRVKLGPRENATVVALQDLFEGLGIHGRLLDVSLGGCCVLIDRVIRIQDGKLLQPTSDMLEPATPLALVRLLDLPQVPTLETGACLCSLHSVDGGLAMCLAFRGMEATDTEHLVRFISGRSPGFTLGFPRKRRMRDRLLEAQDKQGASENPEAPPPEAPADEVAAASASEAASVEAPEPETLSEEQRFRRVKKAAKRILLVLNDELERFALAAQLHGDGYRCVLEARSPIQALEHNRRTTLDLVVLDQMVGPMNALRLLDLLRGNGLSHDARVVVLQRSVDHQLTLALRGGRLHQVFQRPMDFHAAVKGALETLLRI